MYNFSLKKLKFIARNFINDSTLSFISLLNPTWNSKHLSHSREVACFCRWDHETDTRCTSVPMIHTRTHLRRRIAVEIQRIDRAKCHRCFCLWYPAQILWILVLETDSPEMYVPRVNLHSTKTRGLRIYDSRSEAGNRFRSVRHFSLLYNDRRFCVQY